MTADAQASRIACLRLRLPSLARFLPGEGRKQFRTLSSLHVPGRSDRIYRVGREIFQAMADSPFDWWSQTTTAMPALRSPENRGSRGQPSAGCCLRPSKVTEHALTQRPARTHSQQVSQHQRLPVLVSSCLSRLI